MKNFGRPRTFENKKVFTGKPKKWYRKGKYPTPGATTFVRKDFLITSPRQLAGRSQRKTYPIEFCIIEKKKNPHGWAEN